MQWCDEITLISYKEPITANTQINKNGFRLPPQETHKAFRETIFCNKKSVGFSEFYKAQQAGITATLKVDIFTEEYDNQQFAEIDGRRYKILRTYLINSGEHLELTLSDLSEKGIEWDGII